MNTCWSCLVIVDPDVKVCPYCGADQTPLPITIVADTTKPRALTPIFLSSAAAILFVAISIGIVLWSMGGGQGEDSMARAESTATKSLQDVRLMLSEYAIKSGDKYPPALESLSDRINPPIQAIRSEGYELVYSPQASPSDGAIRSYALVARTTKANYRNFYIDQSGVLRATREYRAANDQDPPI